MFAGGYLPVVLRGSCRRVCARLVLPMGLVVCCVAWLAAEPSSNSSDARTASAKDSPQNAQTTGEKALMLQARSRMETSPGSGRYHAVTKELRWDPQKTAIVVCDMWDKHWCEPATERVAEMAPRMNEVINAARERGVLIIHCPSNTMDFYRDHPGRKLAQQAPVVETKIPLKNWCYLDEKNEAPLPIDDKDGGCDCEDTSKSYKAWSKQIDTIEIKNGDAITDSAEAFYLMKQREIDNVIVMGVHTNMCVLGRPFSIRQMVYQGQNVVLMRDMTDSMYSPANRPYVSHFTGTDLVVEHVERHWCPTITSADILGGKPFTFSADKRPHVAIIMAEDEYRTEESLPKFALQELGKEFRVSLIYGSDTDRNDVPGLEALADADLALISVRRRTLPAAQLETIRKFVAAGKPIVGIRTSSHAFALRGNTPAADGTAVWPEFDAEVLGGNYQNHHPEGPQTVLSVAPGAADHEILRGIDPAQFPSHASLYKNTPLQPGAKPLLLGTIPDRPAEPVAWTHASPTGGRVFYTSLGHVKDFEEPQFRRLLANGIRWAAGTKIQSPTPAQ